MAKAITALEITEAIKYKSITFPITSRIKLLSNATVTRIKINNKIVDNTHNT